MGSITFKTPDGQTLWYVLEVRASEPAEVATIEVNAQVRATRQAGVWGLGGQRAAYTREAWVGRGLQEHSNVQTQPGLGQRSAGRVAGRPGRSTAHQVGQTGTTGRKERACAERSTQHRSTLPNCQKVTDSNGK